LDERPVTAEVTIDADDWRGYRFKVTLGGESAQLSSVEVQRDDRSLPLNSWRMQRIPLGLMERALRAKIRDIAPPLFRPEEWPDPDQRTRANRDDGRLAELARAYTETLGQPRQAPTLAERFGYQPSSIPRLIRRARERHLLTATSKGRPGGQLTPRAWALLGGISNEQMQEWNRASLRLKQAIMSPGVRDEVVRQAGAETWERLQSEAKATPEVQAAFAELDAVLFLAWLAGGEPAMLEKFGHMIDRMDMQGES
jgi:hypothetical protein